MRTRLALCLLLTSSIAAPAVAQVGELDQISLPSNAWFNCFDPIHVWQQQVRTGIAGQLEAFEVVMVGSAGSDVNLRLRVGDAWNLSPVLWSTVHTKLAVGNEVVRFNVADQGLVLAEGDTFVIEVQGDNTMQLRGSYVHPENGSSLYPEPLTLSGPGCYLDCGYNIALRTWMIRDLSENYCASTYNSTGAAASMSVSGSFDVTANDLVLHASPAPAGQLGLFLYGAAPNAVLFGDGLLCVAAGAAGLVRLPAVAVDGGGVMTSPLDNTVWGAPATQITPGSTWYFQAWFRDNAGGGAGFNLSDGLEVTFLP